MFQCLYVVSMILLHKVTKIKQIAKLHNTTLRIPIILRLWLINKIPNIFLKLKFFF